MSIKVLFHQYWWIIKVYCWHMRKRDGQINWNEWSKFYTDATPMNEWFGTYNRVIFCIESESSNKRKHISSTSIFCKANICYVLCVFLLFYYLSVAFVVFDFSPLPFDNYCHPTAIVYRRAEVPKYIESNSTIELHRAFMPLPFY